MTKDEKTLIGQILAGQQTLHKKVDDLDKKLMHPDSGLFARVKENTEFRKRNSKLLNSLLCGILLGVIGILFFVIQSGIH